MATPELLPHLFRTEYSKMVAVLCAHFGLHQIEVAEDIVSETFLSATESWALSGLPQNPTAWLYSVSRNKTVDHIRRDSNFRKRITPTLSLDADSTVAPPDIDWSAQHIEDSLLRMLFAVCHPAISPEAQVGLALNVLCGFGVTEIADAFLTSKDTIYKRLTRAKATLRAEQIGLALPSGAALRSRLHTVLTTLYLLFSEGYYSSSSNAQLRKELCLEAMRLTLLLNDNNLTTCAEAEALLALMCFHASRFEARIGTAGEAILYEQQDESRWDKELIARGECHLSRAAKSGSISRFHIEAAIARLHTEKQDTPEKWEQILQLYNQLLLLQYAPAAAMNRTYALYKARGREAALTEALKLPLTGSHLYHCLLAHLYTGHHNAQALSHLKTAWSLARTTADRETISARIAALEQSL